MNFLIEENPTKVVSLLGASLASLFLLFTVTVTDSHFGTVETAVAPVVGSYSKAVASIPSFTNEAVYATAVELGVIPVSQSIYTAVDFPPSGQLLAFRQGSVAGSSITLDQENHVQVIQDAEPLTPVSVLKFLLGR